MNRGPVVTAGAGVPEVAEDDETLREVYAQDELDQDRTPTEAGFGVWKSRRRAVGQAVPPKTPAEARTGVSDVHAAILTEVAKLRDLVALYMPEFGAVRRDSFARLDRIEQWTRGAQR